MQTGSRTAGGRDQRLGEMHAPPIPGRIRLARNLRGLTQEQTIARMRDPISVVAYSQLESGRSQPSDTTRAKLATALEVPIGYFSLAMPTGFIEGVTRPYFRHLRATPMREQKRAAAVAVTLADLVAAIERHVELPPFVVPDYSDAVSMDDAAETLRDEWDLGVDPIEHVVRLLEQKGVPVARLVIGHDGVDAFSLQLSRRPLVLLSDDKQNYVRSRFDAAHELAHLLLHRAQAPGDRVFETQAHDFAGALLVPRQVAHEQLPARMDRIGLQRLLQLKADWGVSVAALVRRARQLDIMTPENYRSAMKQLSARGWRRHEPGDTEMGPAESPILWQRALTLIKDQTGQPVDEWLEGLSLPANDVIKLVGASADTRLRLRL